MDASFRAEMNSRALSNRRPRLGLWLAFLAVAAHLGLALASVGHHARSLAFGAGAPVEVCTISGIERIWLPGAGGAERDTSESGVPLSECAVCSVAGLSAPPTLPPAASFPQCLFRFVAFSFPDGPPATPLALRPPPRAPPRFS